MTVRIRDRFGDYGLVGRDDRRAGEGDRRRVRVDTWLMSCRVIGRTAEQFFFGEFLERARTLGYRRILGEYIPTKKNALVADLYDRLGFAPGERAPTGRCVMNSRWTRPRSP